MSKYIAYVGRVRITSENKQKLQQILRRDRDRHVQAERERRERAIRREIRDFLRRYQSCVFRFGSAEGLLCTFRPRDQKIIARWWVDPEFIPPKPITHVPRLRDGLLEFTARAAISSWLTVLLAIVSVPVWVKAS